MQIRPRSAYSTLQPAAPVHLLQKRRGPSKRLEPEAPKSRPAAGRAPAQPPARRANTLPKEKLPPRTGRVRRAAPRRGRRQLGTARHGGGGGGCQGVPRPPRLRATRAAGTGAGAARAGGGPGGPGSDRAPELWQERSGSPGLAGAPRAPPAPGGGRPRPRPRPAQGQPLPSPGAAAAAVKLQRLLGGASRPRPPPQPGPAPPPARPAPQRAAYPTPHGRCPPARPLPARAAPCAQARVRRRHWASLLQRQHGRQPGPGLPRHRACAAGPTAGSRGASRHRACAPAHCTPRRTPAPRAGRPPRMRSAAAAAGEVNPRSALTLVRLRARPSGSRPCPDGRCAGARAQAQCARRPPDLGSPRLTSPRSAPLRSGRKWRRARAIGHRPRGRRFRGVGASAGSCLGAAATGKPDAARPNSVTSLAAAGLRGGEPRSGNSARLRSASAQRRRGRPRAVAPRGTARAARRPERLLPLPGMMLRAFPVFAGGCWARSWALRRGSVERRHFPAEGVNLVQTAVPGSARTCAAVPRHTFVPRREQAAARVLSGNRGATTTCLGRQAARPGRGRWFVLSVCVNG